MTNFNNNTTPVDMEIFAKRYTATINTYLRIGMSRSNTINAVLADYYLERDSTYDDIGNTADDNMRQIDRINDTVAMLYDNLEADYRIAKIQDTFTMLEIEEPNIEKLTAKASEKLPPVPTMPKYDMGDKLIIAAAVATSIILGVFIWKKL